MPSCITELNCRNSQGLLKKFKGFGWLLVGELGLDQKERFRVSGHQKINFLHGCFELPLNHL